MSTVLEQPPVTPSRRFFSADELLHLSEIHRFELVNGELVERNIGWESEWIGSNLLGQLWDHCRKNACGWVNGANAGYQCFEEVFPDDADRTRKPDVSFISRSRLERTQFPKGHCHVVPDFVTEVISINDLYSDVEEKVVEYLRAGVRLVWVVDPRTESVRIHRTDGTVSFLRVDGELTGEDVIPGFRCRVSELFQDPAQEPSGTRPISE